MAALREGLHEEGVLRLPAADRLHGGGVVPHLWQLYLLTEDPWKKARLIYDIVRHNRQCLLKELAIVMMGEKY
jgi:hypothetical protein